MPAALGRGLLGTGTTARRAARMGRRAARLGGWRHAAGAAGHHRQARREVPRLEVPAT